LSREEKQALEQWLNRIPDDPGGLLKRKFLYQYKQREHQDEGEVSW
jgi:Ca-activated chloride channel family protein